MDLRALDRRALFGGTLFLLAGVLRAAAPPLDLVGRVELVGAGGKSPDLHHALVSFTPHNAAAAAHRDPAAASFEIVTVGKEFRPRVLAVPVGSTVRFPNEDKILHNVFSVSGDNRFDLGLYRAGEVRQVTFASPGLVRVYCNVHHSMVAYVLVLDTPFHTTPNERGAFRLTGLPAGRGTLSVWHERTSTWSREVVLPLDAPLSVPLEVTRSRLPRHLNKFGKPYSRDGRRRYE